MSRKITLVLTRQNYKYLHLEDFITMNRCTNRSISGDIFLDKLIFCGIDEYNVLVHNRWGFDVPHFMIFLIYAFMLYVYVPSIVWKGCKT